MKIILTTSKYIIEEDVDGSIVVTTPSGKFIGAFDNMNALLETGLGV